MDRNTVMAILVCLAGGAIIYFAAQWLGIDVSRRSLIERPPVPYVVGDDYLPPDVRAQVREMQDMHRQLESQFQPMMEELRRQREAEAAAAAGAEEAAGAEGAEAAD
ncbi:MAG: hypothetical protein KDA64_02830 [Rhodospirillaceae bacterium]|nr:hypothetical protein [Rhodospirillaceae bacterium]